jgi:phosphoglycolate phosphatase
MQTAVNGGLYPVGVLWGYRGGEELLKNGARLLIRTPQEYLNFPGEAKYD